MWQDDAPVYKTLSRRFVFMKEGASSLQIILYLFISPDNPRTCGSDGGHTHNDRSTRAPRSDFQYTIIECRGKTVASFSGIHNVEKVNLISHGEKKNAGENWKKKTKGFGTNNEIACRRDIQIRVFTPRSRRAQPFGRQGLLRLKCLAGSDPREDAVIGGIRISHSQPDWTRVTHMLL